MITKLVDNNEFIPEVARLIQEGHTVTIPIRGVSMRPFVEDNRDKALIARCTEPQIGDAILAKTVTGPYVLHRVIGKDSEGLILMGDGNVAGTERCRLEDVVGKVAEFIRKGREHGDSTDGLKWRVYSFFWVRLRPVRRYLLAFYRLIWLRIFK